MDRFPRAAVTENRNIIQDFARYEFKYLLGLSQRQLIEQEISHFMKIDRHIDAKLDDQYFVRSLYFDTPNSVAFYEKTDGVKSRRKFRIRTYGIMPDAGMPLFLEEKGRHNERTYKTRIQIAGEHLPIFLHDPIKLLHLPQYQGVEIVEKFVSDYLRKSTRPRVLVDYLRRPYISDFDMNFRVTLDHEIQAASANELFERTISPKKLCVSGLTVMEIKFNRRIPAWFHRILQAYNLRRLSISKFVVGMKTCGVAVDYS